MAAVLQVEFTVDHIGRRVPESKRWIRWVWEEGPSGRKRDLVLTWSVSSGKQDITLDGSPVAFRQQPGRSVVDIRIERKGPAAEGPALHVVCADVIPNGCSPHSFAQYELLIGDVPFRCHPAHPRGRAVQERYKGGGGHTGMPPASILDILYPGKYDGLGADQAARPPSEASAFDYDAEGGVVHNGGTLAPTSVPTAIDLLDFGTPAPPAQPSYPPQPQTAQPPPQNPQQPQVGFDQFAAAPPQAHAQMQPQQQQQQQQQQVQSFDPLSGAPAASNPFDIPAGQPQQPLPAVPYVENPFGP